MKLYQSKILGTGAYLPKRILNNKDLETMVETSDEWIMERSGIRERRIADTKNGEELTDLGAKAAEMAIANAGIDKNTIDMILFATLTQDQPLPNAATTIQCKLGITNNCAALDVDAACSGFTYALTLANSLIQTGQMKTILVLGGEVLSPLVNWKDRTTCILFGDGVGAMVVGRAEEGEESKIFAAHLAADGAGKDLLYIKAGGTTTPITEEVLPTGEQYIQMKGRDIFKLATRAMAENSRIVLEQSGLQKAELDWLIPHQANIRIIETVAKFLEMDMNKVIVTIEKYGNNSSATIPIAFHEAVTDGRIKRGQIIMFAAFGAGITSASLALRY